MIIFSDTKLTDSAQRLIEEGTAAHELVFSRQLSTSVLAQGESDPALQTAEIAFGQPDPQAILSAPNLRWVQLTSAGFTRYDTAEFRAAAEAKGLVVTNSSTVYAEACAEHVFAFMLAQARTLPTALQSHETSGPGWLQLRASARILRNQRVVILGYGAIAARLAAMLAPFDMEVCALRRQTRGDESVRIIHHDALPAKLAVADHVVNILPESGETRGFMTAERFAQMKPGAVFYNIGRGSTVDQEALAAILRSGHLTAAWLDVTSPEPLTLDHPLRSIANCYITPHTAGGQSDEFQALVQHFLQNLRLWEAGQDLADRIM